MDTISQVQDWILQQETEDPLSAKSADRVSRDLAVGIRNNVGLAKGHCSFCSRFSELSPIVIKCCNACCNRFIQRGHQLNVLRMEATDYRCDSCFSRTFKVAVINPHICQYCARSVGRLHRFERRETEREIQLAQLKRGIL